MYRDRIRIGLGLALGVVLVIGGCGDPDEDGGAGPAGHTGEWSTAGCELARVPRHATVGGITMPVTPQELDAVMARIDRAGRAEFADSFAGLEVDQERVRAIVYRVPSAAFDDFVRRSAGKTCILVRNAAHSAGDLAVWHDRVLADLSFWTHHGVRIVSVGARHDGSGVEIGSTDAAHARHELLARYGAAAPLIFVAEAPARPLATGTTPTPG